MPKPKNKSVTIKITISTSPQNAEMLEWLASRGPYGKTKPEVVERLISEKLRDFLPNRKYEPGKGEVKDD